MFEDILTPVLVAGALNKKKQQKRLLFFIRVHISELRVSLCSIIFNSLIICACNILKYAFS